MNRNGTLKIEFARGVLSEAAEYQVAFVKKGRKKSVKIRKFVGIESLRSFLYQSIDADSDSILVALDELRLSSKTSLRITMTDQRLSELKL
ncbi:MAG TPA: hypothetical protein VGD60_16150 [Candidatus Acidoferrales bacterium]